MSSKASLKFNLRESLDWAVRATPSMAAKKTPEGFILTKGKGCEHCGNTGFSGRLSIAEVIDVNDSMKGLILQGVNANQIEDHAKKEGMIPMFLDGAIKVIQGTTTIEEVLRVMRA